MIVRNEDFEVLSGQTVRYDRKAESGNVTAANFCAHCYGWLWNVPATPGITVVRAGTLDNMDWAEPIGNIWTDSKAAWVKIDPKLTNFPKQAVDRTPLFDAWFTSWVLVRGSPWDHQNAHLIRLLSRPSRASVKGARRARILAIRASSPGLPIHAPFHCCWSPVFRDAITPAINSRSLLLIGVGPTFMGGLEGVSSHLVLDPVTRISVQ